MVATVINFWPQPLDRAMVDRLSERHDPVNPSFPPGLFACQIQVQDHEYACLRVHTQQGDQTHPYCHAQVIAQHIQQPYRSDARKRHGQQDNEALRQR
jgi:hypothetical protein